MTKNFLAASASQRKVLIITSCKDRLLLLFSLKRTLQLCRTKLEKKKLIGNSSFLASFCVKTF